MLVLLSSWHPIDIRRVNDDDDDGDGDDDDGDDVDNEKEADKDDNDDDKHNKPPTIELKVALGSLKDNPAISLLADDNDSDVDDKNQEAFDTNNGIEQHNTVTTPSQNAVSKLLVDDADKKEDPIKKKKKVLIEELS